jgi:hypothetical protein
MPDLRALANRVDTVVRELELLAVQRTVSKQRLREVTARLDDIRQALLGGDDGKV